MLVSFQMYSKPGVGLNWEMTNPTAFWMIVVPYIAGGLYCRLTGEGLGWAYPVLVSLIPTAAERILILFIGYRLYVSGGDGSIEGISLLTFIRGEAVPFFTTYYIFFGFLLSISITVLAANFMKPKRLNQNKGRG